MHKNVLRMIKDLILKVIIKLGLILWWTLIFKFECDLILILWTNLI